MSHSEEIRCHPIRKSIKDICQYTGSNKINDYFGQIAKDQTLCRSYSNLQHVVKRSIN